MDEEKIIIKPLRDVGETDKAELGKLLKTVAIGRNNIETIKQKKSVAEEVLAQTAEGRSFQSCVELLGKCQEQLSEAEDTLKSAVLEVYKETKERKPIDKVEVKIFKSLKYDALKALDWCRAFAPTLLMVNKKLFEKMAPDMGGPVEVKEEPKCYVAKDLSSYLEAAKESAA